MDVIRQKLTAFILDPANHDLLEILKGARNGLVYGAKVRFPHALVMTFLFRSGTFQEKLTQTLQATKTHAKNLAAFVTIYKTAMFLLRRLSSSTRKERSSDSFFAGLLGGYLVFGRGDQGTVNQQIVIYVFARVVLALAKLSVEKGVIKDPRGRVKGNSWGVFAAVSWGLVMWLFRWEAGSLQGSLRSSMEYLYIDSGRWDSLRNFLIHNT
ncbi:Tim17/Tim22/Tim23/Pmp24 family-domain-containing protein [Tuber borchii]|uniref:Tim17/Tim22/Tim23/Pmp24 family-domain-containing protein n=1 Tax=Tuber borchii TaxID=42251 RepID=A0A2T7A385_TUBBO|nr:Tim17/Tim22/Tim23/Pmp24 family-domain-containing protein [Tuber borchii]